MIVLYYEALKIHEDNSTVAELKVVILLWQDMQNTPCTTDIYSLYFTMLASKIGEAVVSPLRQSKLQLKELRDDIKALKDDNREFKKQLRHARPSHRTAALLSSRASADHLTRIILGIITGTTLDVFRGSWSE